jgi:hypothetical protein
MFSDKLPIVLLQLSFSTLLACSLLSYSQETGPVFRTGTRLVEVSIVAIDKKSEPVLDLKQSEISITDNGKTRPLSVFQFDGIPYLPTAPQALPAGAFSNKIEYTPGPPRNVTAVLFDAVNTAPELQPRAYAQLTKLRQDPRSRYTHCSLPLRPAWAFHSSFIH